MTIAIKHHLVDSVLKIDHTETKGLELIHIRIGDSVIPLNVLGVYIDNECRLDREEILRIMNKLTTLLMKFLSVVRQYTSLVTLTGIYL